MSLYAFRMASARNKRNLNTAAFTRKCVHIQYTYIYIFWCSFYSRRSLCFFSRFFTLPNIDTCSIAMCTAFLAKYLHTTNPCKLAGIRAKASKASKCASQLSACVAEILIAPEGFFFNFIFYLLMPFIAEVTAALSMEKVLHLKIIEWKPPVKFEIREIIFWAMLACEKDATLNFFHILFILSISFRDIMKFKRMDPKLMSEPLFC